MLDTPGPNGKLFTYMRYDAELTRSGLDQLGLTSIKVSDVQKMDSVDHIDELWQIGDALGKQLVNMTHYQAFLS